MEAIDDTQFRNNVSVSLEIPERNRANWNRNEVIGPPNESSFVFLIFVNPLSGGGKAAALTKLDVEKIIFSPCGIGEVNAELYIYNFLDSKSREKGFQTLKREQEQGRTNLYVIVGGGDGTVLWVIEKMIAATIDFSKCVIGVIPFGTGNDFSRVLGWGGCEPSPLVGMHLNGLKSLTKRWIKAQIQDFDIWEIVIETYEDGGIKKIFREKNKKFMKQFIKVEDDVTKTLKNTTMLKKRMCNYFSLGVDSRIGYGFDKRRTNSRCGNKLLYCWEGFKKLFLRTPRINDVLEVVHYEEVIGQPGRQFIHDVNVQQVGQISSENFNLYPSTAISSIKEDIPDTKISVIKGNPATFLCLNIPSFMGGASDPWKTSKGKIGVTNRLKALLPDFEDQKFGDGKLELLGFSGPISLAMERFRHGQAWRLGQVKGPFALNFKQSTQNEKKKHTYMEIDGEFYDIVAPKAVRVSLCEQIPNGKVKVIVDSKNKK